MTEPWPAGEMVDRAQGYFAYALTGPLPQPGESTSEKFLVQAATNMCCTDALTKLTHAERVKILTDPSVWGAVAENYIGVSHCVTALFRRMGYETGDLGEILDSLKVVWQIIGTSAGLPPEEVEKAWPGIPPEEREGLLIAFQEDFSRRLQPLLESGR